MSESPVCRLRVSYVKSGRLKYLGHLEVLHTVERIVRRAGLPYAVTQGFSPHMKMGFSSALPVGTSSTCEWFDLYMMERLPESACLERLVAASPADLAPTGCGYIDVFAPALTAVLTHMEYEVTLHPAEGASLNVESIESACSSVRALHALSYARGKKSKTLDLDHTLKGVEVSALDDGTFKMFLSCHSDNDGSMRPELLVAAMDRVLAGRGDTLESEPIATGVQKLATIAAFDVVRIEQAAENAEGEAVSPLAHGGRPLD